MMQMSKDIIQESQCLNWSPHCSGLFKPWIPGSKHDGPRAIKMALHIADIFLYQPWELKLEPFYKKLSQVKQTVKISGRSGSKYPSGIGLQASFLKLNCITNSILFENVNSSCQWFIFCFLVFRFIIFTVETLMKI